jgi:hypothetical protein
MSVIAEIIQAHANIAQAGANEAETRLKVIDRVLFEILEWTHDDVSVEERTSEDGTTTFVDYVVRTAGSSFVIEAKKVGAAFTAVPDVRRRRLTSSFVAGAHGDAILQARDYCRRKGIPFAVVTNGTAWIAFPAVRIDQVSFADSSAVIFPSLESALRDDYAEFTHLLSRNEVIAGSLEAELLGRTEDQIGGHRLNRFFTNRGPSGSRNPLYPLIEEAIVTAFTDSIVDTDPELLEKCYVQTPERIKFDRQINMYISKHQSVFGRQPIRPLQRKESRALKETIEQSRIRARPVAILVLGTVGAGKTTFLHYTRQVSSASYFKPSDAGPYPHWIYIDFRDFGPGGNVAEFLYERLRAYATEDRFLSNYEMCVRPGYIDQIRALREGPLKVLGDEEKINERIADYLLAQSHTTAYVDRLLTYAASKAPVFMVVDNVDQFESADQQSRIFSESIALAHKNRMNLVLSLREATFVRHRSSPTFDAFDFAPIAIDAPAVLAVLSKRFFLANQLLKGKQGKFIAENGARVDVADLSIVADLISSSVLGTSVGTTIDILATSDVRLALRMTREFLESGYTNPGRAISTYNATGKYILPRHEALRSVLLGNHPVYSEEFSIVANPFDARLSRSNHQMLRLMILTALVTMSSRSDFRYVDGADITVAVKKIGFGDTAIKRVLEDLCAARFTFTSAHGEPTLSSSFYPSRLGGLIVRNLMADPTFLEAVMMDTFIASDKEWDKLKALSEDIDAERNVVQRLILRHERIRLFYAAMHHQYSHVLDEARRRALPNDWCEDPFSNVATQLQRNLQKALSSAIRNYAKNA